MLFLMNATWPSANATLRPPGWPPTAPRECGKFELGGTGGELPLSSPAVTRPCDGWWVHMNWFDPVFFATQLCSALRDSSRMRNVLLDPSVTSRKLTLRSTAAIPSLGFGPPVDVSRSGQQKTKPLPALTP